MLKGIDLLNTMSYSNTCKVNMMIKLSLRQ
nr:MAG TPA: hypothetical protein [Caudoviricetes sp.]